MTPGLSAYISIVMVICVTGSANADMALRKARILAPELFMKAPERAAKAGYKMETHHVQTADGYIIGLHRLPGKKSSPPVLFQHGQTSMSDSWIAFGPKRSLAYRLADSGYDVWLGNARGNLYSRNHTTLNPEEPEFWKFSWHEMGIYDLPASIDYILNTTGQSRLFYVGHSMGGTMVHVLLSMKPEYNAKMRLVIGLAPGVFYNHFSSLPTISGIKSWPILKEVLHATERYELLPYSEPTIALMYYLCSNSTVQMAACEMLVEETFGKSDGLNKGEIPLLAAMAMGGNSAFTTDHFVQLIKSGKFQQFDFGPEENQRRYRSSTPPEYNLKMVTAPVAIHYGQTDKLVSVQMTMILDGAALLLLLTVITVDGQSAAEEPISKARILAPDLFMKTPERARKDGYQLETHHVLSPDGYILGLHRIPGGKSAMPILLYHALSSRSDCWIAFSPPERSLAYQLADRGYDVWMGNARGNLYSRNHTTLKPSEPAFWKYTLHEMGVNDVSATIDYILNITGHDQLFYVGHSMGNTLIYVLLSTRPEYNAKMRLVISLSPAVFIGNFTSRLASAVMNLRSYIKVLLDTTKNYELIPDSPANLAFVYFLCQNGAEAQGLCELFMAEVLGKSSGWILGELPLMVAIGSGGMSAFTLWHFLQLMDSGKFQQWDYGVEGNELNYGSPQPPEYNLTKVTAPVVIYYGESDSLVTKKDVVHFSKVLPNVVDVRRVPTRYFNHLDFVAHSRIKELLFDEVVNTVDKYSSIKENVPHVIGS